MSFYLYYFLFKQYYFKVEINNIMFFIYAIFSINNITLRSLYLYALK